MKLPVDHSPTVRRLPLAIALALALQACSSSAPLAPQATPAPAQFKEGAALWKPATAQQPATPEAWWEVFQDPQLNQLQQALAIGNENLKSAMAAVANARAALDASRSTTTPSLAVSAGASRSGSAAQGAIPATVANNFTLGASAAWEADLWGRLAQGVTAAGANYQASANDLDAARLSAQASLAQSYFSLRTAELQLGLLHKTEAAEQRTVELTQAQHAAGVVAQSDVLQAQAQLKAVQVQLRELALQRSQLEHAIAVLLGKPPSELTIEATAQLPALPALPPLLPSTLLERRPDVAAAERRVASAYANIGVAQAAFFPDLSLAASVGYRGTAWDQVVAAPNLLWSIGPTLAYTLFDGGARRAASAQAQAAADAATASYRQTVLTALQEVEDNLAALTQLQQEIGIQQEVLDASRRSLDIVLAQYQAGTVNFISVAAAQNAALASENTLLALQNRALLGTALLLKNLGGRWHPVPA